MRVTSWMIQLNITDFQRNILHSKFELRYTIFYAMSQPFLNESAWGASASHFKSQKMREQKETTIRKPRELILLHGIYNVEIYGKNHVLISSFVFKTLAYHVRKSIKTICTHQFRINESS